MTPPSFWTPDHVAGIARQAIAYAPLITSSDVRAIAPDLDIWDAWPVQLRNGQTARFGNDTELWMALAAPVFANPEERHAHARIHMIVREGATWRHLGPAMPDGFSPGSREWSGSAVFEPDTAILTLYFTAAGRRGEPRLSYEQRLFSAKASIAPDLRCVDWRDLAEIVEPDPLQYMATHEGDSAIGTIKAFRDPAWFCDPADGRAYLLFAGSKAGSSSLFNGVVGMTAAGTGPTETWTIRPPIVEADGLNNELERPHIIHHQGLYYLFWSTQAHVFDPAGPTGPTGLYGMVSQNMAGPWQPLNGTGLVMANPPEAPAQAYSWWVMPDLSVTSFIDKWGPEASPSLGRRFGGTFAPFVKLRLTGMIAGLED